MTKSLTVAAAYLAVTLGTVGLMWSPDEAMGSTFTKVAVQAVDPSAQRLTFRTVEGQVWTLTAASPDLLKDLHTGDICSLEIDSEDRVIKIVKTNGP
ncbi:MAG TPA: hypothetical protein VHF07_00905 [Nitrospiraceae bacterium]|nr:hypothetical protein [Nitrospiraceae bacterium]